MSASTAPAGYDTEPVTPASTRRRPELRLVTGRFDDDGGQEPIPCPGSPPLAAISLRRLDPESRAWLEALDSEGQRREEAIARLHALLLREARFEVRRR